MGIDLLPEFIREHYDHREWRHACAILKYEYPNEWNDVLEVLMNFRLLKSNIIKGGGNKSLMSTAIDSALYDKGWRETKFNTKMVVDETERITPTHKIDCYKNRIALEVEWNNKDPFFDRDLNNFRLLFDLHTVSVGIIVTRSDELKLLKKAYSENTTHWGQLIPRIEGGGGGGCPILAFGIKLNLLLEEPTGEPTSALAAALVETASESDQEESTDAEQG